MALFRLFVIGLLVYLILRFISRSLFPFLYTNNNKADQKRAQGKKEGEITIENTDNSKSDNNNSQNGEYIDYEEIE